MPDTGIKLSPVVLAAAAERGHLTDEEIPAQSRARIVTASTCAVTVRRGTLRSVNAAQTWTLVGTVVALSTALVSVIIAFMTTRFAVIDRRFDEMDRRFDGVDRRFDGVEGRLDRVEGVVTGLDRDVQTLTRHVLGEGAGPG